MHALALAALLAALPGLPARAQAIAQAAPAYTISPVGRVRKKEGRTFIEIEPRYTDALLGVDQLTSLWVLYWFDRNDTPEKRASVSSATCLPNGNCFSAPVTW